MNSRQLRQLKHAERNGQVKDLESKPAKSKSKEEPARSRFKVRATILGVMAILGFGDQLYGYRPQIRVLIENSLDSRDTFATQIGILNDSKVTIKDVIYTCSVDESPALEGVRVTGLHGAPEISPGGEIVRKCGFAQMGGARDTEIVVTVECEYPILGHQKVSVRFVSEPDEKGIPQWVRSES